MATTRFYLDTRRSAEDGTSLLKLTFTKDRRNVYISLDVRLLPSQWDERNCRIVGLGTVAGKAAKPFCDNKAL